MNAFLPQSAMFQAGATDAATRQGASIAVEERKPRFAPPKSAARFIQLMPMFDDSTSLLSRVPTDGTTIVEGTAP